MKNLSNSVLLLMTILISGCFQSSFGAKKVAQGLSSNDQSSSQSNSIPDDSLEEGVELEEGSLDFLDNVATATYTISGNSISLKLKDMDGLSLAIPSDVKSTLVFKSTSKFLLVNLGDDDIHTTLIIDKDTRQVYLTKDTDIELLHLNTAVLSTLKINNINKSVLKVQALLSATGRNVYVGLAVSGNKLNAYKL